jgi:hypothetical protein
MKFNEKNIKMIRDLNKIEKMIDDFTKNNFTKYELLESAVRNAEEGGLFKNKKRKK